MSVRELGVLAVARLASDPPNTAPAPGPGPGPGPTPAASMPTPSTPAVAVMLRESTVLEALLNMLGCRDHAAIHTPVAEAIGKVGSFCSELVGSRSGVKGGGTGED
jgi:hypothetical protein